MQKLNIFALSCWVMLTVTALSQTNETARVVDAGGGFSSNAAFFALGAIGQGSPVGFNSSATHLNYSGFLHAFLLHTNLDTDVDGIVDENDPDDDDDGLQDGDELAGTRFNPTTSTDPLNPDSDSDGATDGEESRAGTNPHDQNSLLRIVEIINPNGMARLFWNSRDTYRYEIYRAANIVDLANNPDSVVSNITASGGSPPWFETQTGWTNLAGTSQKQEFYGLKVLGP